MPTKTVVQILLIVMIVAGIGFPPSGFSSEASTAPSVSSTLPTQSSPSPDFSIIASSNHIIQNGANPPAQIQVSSSNGFTGSVGLSVVTNSTNISCSISPVTITGGSGYSYVSCSSSVSGAYLATVTGTSGTISHSTSVTEYYPPSNAGFVVWTDTTDITIAEGGNSSIDHGSIVEVVPLTTFTSGITLTVSTNSTGLACNFSPNGY